MVFTETPLKGAFVIDVERHEDERGFFARTFCRSEFAGRGLDIRVAQCSVSFNKRKGTLRGMHFQAAPHGEAKLIRCTAGSIFDAIIDLRSASATYKKYFGIELSVRNGKMLYVPEGFAHGFQTLEDNTEVAYQMSQPYAPEAARGYRWNDPTFGIQWPPAERIIIERDRSYPDFSDLEVASHV